MKFLVIFILFLSSCSIDSNQFNNEPLPIKSAPVEQKKDTTKIKKDTIKPPPVKPAPNPSKKQYYYYMKINHYKRNPVT